MNNTRKKISTHKQYCIKNFDSKFYLSQNIDVLESKLEPLEHYINYGYYEGRKPFKDYELPILSMNAKDFQSDPEFPIQLYIPTFNNPTYLLNFINQIKNIDWLDIIIYDNNSKTKKMKSTLRHLEIEGYRIIRRKDNLGPESIYLNHGALNLLPEYFLLSDPDLDLKNLTKIENIMALAKVSEYFQLGKVGFALHIEKNRITDKKLNHDNTRISTYDWEKQFWLNRIGYLDNGNTIYSAAVGATFCLINKKYLDLEIHWSRGARVGGSFTITHLPWVSNFSVPAVERWNYKRLQKHSFYTLPTIKKKIKVNLLFRLRFTSRIIKKVLSKFRIN